jgi:hypothetical protein
LGEAQMMAADDNLRAVLGSLEATFDARVARAEDEAASDLAFSLLQDLSLSEAATRAGALEIVMGDRAPLPVAEVGVDYVAASGRSPTVVPLGRAALRTIPAGRAPESLDRSLLELLRAWAREGRAVAIHAGGGVHRGRLVRACRDHVVVNGYAGTARGDDVLVPLEMIEQLRLEGERP